MCLEPTFLYCSNDDDFRVMTWMETFNSEAFDIQTKQNTNLVGFNLEDGTPVREWLVSNPHVKDI